MADNDERSLPCGEPEDVASATECTGLVPALEPEAAEADRRALYGLKRGTRTAKMYRKK